MTITYREETYVYFLPLISELSDLTYSNRKDHGARERLFHKRIGYTTGEIERERDVCSVFFERK
jgi:hypothetical protein